MEQPGTSEEMAGYLLGKRRITSLVKRDDDNVDIEDGIPKSEFTTPANVASVRDTVRRVQEDPTLAIRKQEETAYEALVDDPMQRRLLSKAADRDVDIELKEDRHRHRHHHHYSGHRRRDRSRERADRRGRHGDENRYRRRSHYDCPRRDSDTSPPYDSQRRSSPAGHKRRHQDPSPRSRSRSPHHHSG